MAKAKTKKTNKSSDNKVTDKKTTTKKTTTKKTATKKTATKKSGKSKNTTQKTASPKRVPKRTSNTPSGLVEQKAALAKGSANVAVKKRKVRKKMKKPMERKFWIVIFTIFVVLAAAGAYYVFKDYYKDSSTPAQREIEDISAEDTDFLKTLGEEPELIESLKIHPQGPIVYMIYTVPAGTPRQDAMNTVTDVMNKAAEQKPEVFNVYEFELTITNSGEEAEGVNDYPVAGSKNVGVGVKWMDTSGTYVKPVEEPEESVEGGSEDTSGE